MKISGARGGRARLLAGTLGVTTALGLGGAPVLATTVEREHFEGTDSYSYTDCGFPVDVAVTFSGHSVIRATKGGEAFLGSTTTRFTEVHTNLQNGKSFVLRGKSLFKELHATQVDGTIYRFEAIEAGQPFVIEDAGGKVVVRDRGVIRYTALFDTLGDGVPSAELVEDLGAVVHGPHAGFSDDFDFCGTVADLIGS